MNKKITSIMLILILAVIIVYAYKQITKQEINKAKEILVTNNNLISKANQTADKLQIYYFHRTQRCSTCRSIGRFTRELIEQKFAEQVKNGRIDFREVNVELPENKELANKFKATGPSLFINAIKNNVDNMNQDINIWRLTKDESQFKNYLGNKISILLGV